MILNMVGGGGVGLNYSVKAYVSESALPSVEKENAIAVFTDVEITSHNFNATEPGFPEEGMVWITVGTSSPVAFSATKKDPITVYPTGCAQYIDGAWVSKDAKTYQNGVWLPWMLYLYDDGTFSDVSGTMVQRGITKYGTAGSCSISQGETSVTIRSDSGSCALAYFCNKIDLTPYKALCFCGYAKILRSGGSPNCGIGVWDASFGAVALLEGMRSDGLHTLDISELSGEYYIGIAVSGFSDYMECVMSELYLK